MRSLFAVLFFLVFANSLLFADQIAFKNGDRLTGAILKSDAKILVIRTSAAGEVTAAWQEIQGLTSLPALAPCSLTITHRMTFLLNYVSKLFVER